MKTKAVLIAGLAVVIVCAVASVVVAKHEAARRATLREVKADSGPARNQQRPAPAPVMEPAVPELLTPEPISPPPAGTGGSGNVRTQAVAAAAQPYSDPRLNDPVFKEQVGRYALSFVGDDPDADEVWIQVINDPSLAADARRELIEDLNQDGLPDPRNPTVDDLPVILSRIQLIEELAPDAMDQVNWDAFAEAYKDLVTMAVRLSGR
jgi:hypothetical protein